MTSVWEKCDLFGVKVELENNVIKFPRQGDKWLMILFVLAGFSKEDLIRLNRVRVHQQVLFLSCVLGASGKTLDKKYLKKRSPTETWSQLSFPKEKPPNKDFHLWRIALHQIVPIGGIQDRLGRFNHEGYKKWDWRWDVDKTRLLHYREGLMDVYKPSNLPRMLNVPNRWTRTRCGQKVEKCGQVCTVREVAVAVKAVLSTAEPPREEQMPNKIKEVLEEWGGDWMWKSLRILGNDG